MDTTARRLELYVPKRHQIISCGSTNAVISPRVTGYHASTTNSKGNAYEITLQAEVIEELYTYIYSYIEANYVTIFQSIDPPDADRIHRMARDTLPASGTNMVTIPSWLCYINLLNLPYLRDVLGKPLPWDGDEVLYGNGSDRVKVNNYVKYNSISLSNVIVNKAKFEMLWDVDSPDDVSLKFTFSLDATYYPPTAVTCARIVPPPKSTHDMMMDMLSDDDSTDVGPASDQDIAPEPRSRGTMLSSVSKTTHNMMMDMLSDDDDDVVVAVVETPDIKNVPENSAPISVPTRVVKRRRIKRVDPSDILKNLMV